MDSIVSLAIGFAAAAGWLLVAWLGFREGMKMGLRAAQGLPPQPVIKQVISRRERKQEKEEREREDLEAQGIRNILGFDGTLPKEQKKQGRAKDGE